MLQAKVFQHFFFLARFWCCLECTLSVYYSPKRLWNRVSIILNTIVMSWRLIFIYWVSQDFLSCTADLMKFWHQQVFCFKIPKHFYKESKLKIISWMINRKFLSNITIYHVLPQNYENKTMKDFTQKLLKIIFHFCIIFPKILLSHNIFPVWAFKG